MGRHSKGFTSKHSLFGSLISKPYRPKVRRPRATTSLAGYLPKHGAPTGYSATFAGYGRR